MATVTRRPKRTPPAERLLTAADLAALPTSLPTGDVRYELNDGRLVVMPPPGDIHGKRQGKIIRYLDSEAEERGLGEMRGEVGIVLRRNPDRVVGADAAFILTKSLPVRRTKEGYLETIPELVVEIRSKNDRTNKVRAKKEEYFQAGVSVVWVLDPDEQTVTAYYSPSQSRVFRSGDTLVCDLLPGFAVPVDKLFVGS
jgi:Uma2 family endonuclease